VGRLTIKARLGTCGRCGKPLGNPLTHVCVTRLDKPRRKTKTRLRPKVSVSVKCPKCGKPFTNPLAHTCKVKTDWRRRQAAAARAAKPSPRKAKPPRVMVVRPAGSQKPAHRPRPRAGIRTAAG
jgi:hypothetical protein